MATIGFSKVFILDKYFTELQKFWETEKKLQGMQADSSNEKAHLQQRLKNLSSELVTLRNNLHVSGANSTHNSDSKLTTGTERNRPQISSILNHHPSMSANGHFHTDTISPRILSVVSPSGQNLPPAASFYGTLPASVTGFATPKPPVPPNHPVLGSQPYLKNGATQYSSSSSSAFYVNQPLFKTELIRTAADATSDGRHFSTNAVLSKNSVSANSAINNSSISSNTSSLQLPSLPKVNIMGNPKCNSTPGQSQIAISATTSLRKVQLGSIEDLINLPGPMTEDSLIRCLQARCGAGKHFVYMGPILLLTNPFTCAGNPLTLSSVKALQPLQPITKVVQEALRQLADTGYPQAIVLSGCSGSGKTYTSMLILRQLFEIAGGGTETDVFKHLTASTTVLRSLGTARTASNAESSRIGHFIEVQVTDGSLYRAKMHCYFLDQSRVVRSSVDEGNYHIFYQMLAGLSTEDRSKLHLGNHTARTLRYLNSLGDGGQLDEAENGRRFLDWKTCLCSLGIPFLDVVRVLASVVLIGNVKFQDAKSCLDLEVEEGISELQGVASLLGVSETALRQGLITRTHNSRGHLIRSRCDAHLANSMRDALAKSLYCRTVATIVRRANSIRRLNCTSGTLSSDSAESIHNQTEVASQHASTVGTAGSKASKSMTALMAAVRHATDGFIGILDMFGFEDVKRSRLEHICINLCAETMQHFYNTHVFKASSESCREEGIQCDDIEYHDNVPCIDLISSLRTGLLSMLDVECSIRGTVDSYISKVRHEHEKNPRFLETRPSDLRAFSIQHFAGKVIYDVTEFPDTNRDILADDLVAVFHKHRCSFGFASHLFSPELKVLGASGTVEPCPKGISFRILPTSNTEMLNGDEPVSTFTQDFHTRLDNLLRTLVHTKPHFVRCLKINYSEQQDLFDRYAVSKQLRAFQVLETVNLMAYGYPHRLRFRAFNARYRLLLDPLGQFSRADDRGALEESRQILNTFNATMDLCVREKLGHISHGCTMGNRHVFLSEGARQELENQRFSRRNRAALLIQSTYRGWCSRKHLPVEDPARETNKFNEPEKPKDVTSDNNNKLGDPLAETFLDVRSRVQEHLEIKLHVPLETNTSNTQSLRQNCKTVSQQFQSTNDETHLTVLQQACPVPAQRTSSATVISNAGGIYSTINPNYRNYKNIAPILDKDISKEKLQHPPDALSINGRPRPQPISRTPPPDSTTGTLQEASDRADMKAVQETCALRGLDMDRPPALPKSRAYTISGNTKIGFPQTRVLKRNFPDETGNTGLLDVRLTKGELVSVVGISPRRGHVVVEHRNKTLHLPHQYLELRVSH